MVRIGGFLKTQNRSRRQRARGRFISPYHVGGTIFVHHGALSLDAHVLPPIGPHDPETLETTQPPKDERGHDFWQVHTHAHATSWITARVNPEQWRGQWPDRL